MKNAAAIQAQLVDMRNVGAHKSLKLTLHVPEELALKAIEAFGWPTGAAPVSVALARLDERAAAEAPRETVSDSSDGNAAVSRPRKPISLAQQAAICCGDPLFWRFLESVGYSDTTSSEIAAEAVRHYCNVTSRKEIKIETPAAGHWRELHGDFLVWRDNPDLVPDPPRADCQNEREQVG